MKSLKSSSRDIAVVVVFPEVTEVVEFADAEIEADSSSDVDNRSLSKVSSLLFRLSPFDFRLKGLENLDKHLDDEDVDEIVEALELPPLEQASMYSLWCKPPAWRIPAAPLPKRPPSTGLPPSLPPLLRRRVCN